MSATKVVHRQIQPHALGSGDFLLIVQPEASAIEVATLMEFAMPWSMVVTDMFAFLSNPAGGLTYIDVRLNNTSMFDTEKLQIDIGEHNSNNSVAPFVFSSWFNTRNRGITVNQRMKVACTYIGYEDASGAGLKIVFKGNRDDSITDLVT